MAPLERLRLCENGFAFDTATGHSYTLSATARQIVCWLRDGCSADEATALLWNEYEIDAQTARRDVDDFLASLRNWRLL